jgi:uroporphyrinogen decarboxylase
MDSRERVLVALDHRTPDRVPCDLGGTIVTGIHVEAYRSLREYLGMPEQEIVVIDPVQGLARVDDDLRERLGVDTMPVSPADPRTTRLRTSEDAEFTYIDDDYGLRWRKPKDGGFYHDLCVHPLAGDISRADIDRHALPDPADEGRFAGLREACLKARDEDRKATVMWGFGGGAFETAGWLRGLEQFYMDLALDPGLACAIVDRLLEIKLGFLERALAQIGDVLDVVGEGDDLGGQHAPLISPDMYRKLVKPRHRQLFQFIHEHSRAKIMLHSCGSIRPLIPDLIEIGVDILNPVQVSAADMDSADLKREFGREIAFWGGGVETQHVLPFGTPQEVRDDVRRRLDDLMPGGGYVFNPVHNIQAGVPPRNIIAMWEAYQEHGIY